MKKVMKVRKGGSHKVNDADAKKLADELAEKMDLGIKKQHRKKPGEKAPAEAAVPVTDETQETDHAG